MQYILSIDGLFTGIIALIFGLIVLSKNKKNIVNQTAFLLTVATTLWAFGYWRWLTVYDDKSLALVWIRILSVGSTLIPIFYFHWIISLLELNKKKKTLIILCYILVVIFLLFSFSSLFIRDTKLVDGFSFWPQPGLLYTFYLFFVYFGLVSYSVYLLVSHFRGSSGLRREQIKYVLLGSVLGFGGGATNFFMWYGVNILPWGNFLVVLYPILFSYSIIKHRLMDIKLVLRRSSVYLFSFATILALSIGSRYLLNNFVSVNSGWLDLAVLILALYIFPPVKDFYYRLANKFFFSSFYDSGQLIAKLSDKLRSTLDIRQIYESVAGSLIDALRVKTFGVLGYDKSNDEYFVLYNQGFLVESRQRFLDNQTLYDLFVSQSKSIVVEELKNASFFAAVKDTYDLLNNLKVAVLVPLNIKDETLGLLALGPKESGDMFNDEDLRTLEVVGSQAAIAIKNAQLYEETKNFSAKLQAEVARQTAELRQANEDLKKLDKAKSDFISIASHQLRTPLSIVKGFVSMILEGSYGSIAPEVREKLENIYESNERLNRLVDDLLDLSHMEGGKMKFEFTKVNFAIMAQSVVEELRPSAEKKKLKLSFKTPEEKFFVRADEGKLRQVVFNLVDNAIKYTNQGGVVVSLESADGKIRLAIKDTGIGISQEDLESLFQKFNRGANASRYHTEGVGIGLYVARKIIGEHKGRVWAESAGDGQGSQFYLELPKWE